MTKPAASTDTEAAMMSAIEVAPEGEVSRRVLLVPYGKLYGRDGRGPWLLEGKDHAEQVIDATRQHLGQGEFLINYDHQSEYSAVPGTGGQAKAAGWIKPDALSAGDDGIYADVDWTPAAEAALNAREYRYQSPHFRFSRSTGRLTRLTNAALTNSPNLDLPALASQQPGASTEGVPMTMIALASLAAALAMPATAGEADVLAAIGGLKKRADDGDAALNSTRETLGLGDDADTAAVLNAIGGLKAGDTPDPTKWVPKAGYDELKGRVDRLDEDRVLNMVDQAVEGGKLAPSMRDWAISLGKKDEAALNSYLGVAPTFNPGATVKGDPKPEKGKLTEDEAAICSQLGIPEAEYLKTRDEEGNV